MTRPTYYCPSPGPEPANHLRDFVEGWGAVWMVSWPLLLMALALDWWRA